MSNFISNQIINSLNSKFGNVGEVKDLSISKENISISLQLAGENELVDISIDGLAWNTSDGKMNLYYGALECKGKIWIQEIFKMIAEKTNHCISFPDSIKLMPLKMFLKKK